ncbi:hypothetical protein SVXHr_2743 [Halorhabdus sp. SVX81]|uniref:hypothetical protein n=1 Tax=Halorhabdus sp. SVX81 TaxID=2978283 RepID=UPI0023DC64B5|nr:hypothetical protein [Halorhabdus sp. SVX81]WEL18886.1 hypothetical protein SVXHr_2743 [Halorhabdus sp. SVX81]
MRRLTDPIGTRLLNFITNESVKEDANERLKDPASVVRQAREEFLDYFAGRTKVYLLVAAALLAAIGVVDIGTCGAVPNQSYGLTLDLFGAIVLARGLLKGPYGMAAESGEYWNQSPPLRRALAEDAADGIWGVTLLVTGILLQFLAVAGVAVFTYQNCPF